MPMPLYEMPEGVETRWASPENPRGRKGSAARQGKGRKGNAYFFVRPGRRLTIAQAQGSGVVRRIWLTLHGLDALLLKQLRLLMTWDDALTPAVDVPLGDFFGMPLGRLVAFENDAFSSPEGRSFCCFLPMPFRTSMRIEIANDGGTTANMLYYDVDFTLGDVHEEGMLYFQAWYHQEAPTCIRRDYTVLDTVRGRGRYLGASFGVQMDRERYLESWGGEGEVKIFLDADQVFPTLCGTGTEDYIGTGWSQGVFAHRTQGCTVADEQRMQLCFYRFHLPDPVWFHSDIRVTIQQIGSWNRKLLAHFHESGAKILRAGVFAEDDPRSVEPGGGALPDFDLFERSDAWSSCCYFYLDRPEHGIPVLEDLRERIRSVPDFDAKELMDVERELPPVRLAKKHIPDLDRLELEELRELAAALDSIVRVLTEQEKALQEGEERK